MDPRELLSGLESIRDKGFCYSEFITSTLWQSVKNEKPGMSPQEIWLTLTDKEKIFVNPQDIETVTQQITATWEKIRARDFYTGCGKEDCHWCNFVKDNKLAVALHELSEQEPEEM